MASNVAAFGLEHALELPAGKSRKGQWLRLLTFCTLAGLAAALGLAALFATASLALASTQADDDSQSAPQIAVFSGVITDSNCNAKHRLTDQSPASCTRICIRDGASYTLVDGEKVFQLNGDVVALSQHAGQRASITGTQQGNSIQVKSIND